MQNELLMKILNELGSIQKKLNMSEDESLGDYISEQDAKELFKRGTTWFWNLRKQGLPYSKLGGEVYYRRSDLKEWLDGRREG